MKKQGWREALVGKHLPDSLRHIVWQQAGGGVTVLDCDGVRYLDAPSGARIAHAEHKEIAVPPGQYLVDIVREYDHFPKPSQSAPGFLVAVPRVDGGRPS